MTRSRRQKPNVQLEDYSDERLKEFLSEDRLSKAEAARIRKRFLLRKKT